jgi:ubiquinone/menaquinone biosynthesis C-methylase UbiE
MLSKDAEYFLELQTQTGWGRALYGFAKWCAPQPGWHTLDVGCGPGLLPAIFTQFGCWAVGIDLDMSMFRPSPLHPIIAVADAYALPFLEQSFDLVTASNLIFLLPEPVQALLSMKQILSGGGRIALLNPSEALNEQVATTYANENGLQGIARDTLINWAKRSEAHHRWTEAETHALYTEAGMKCMDSTLKVGPGFGRFSWGTRRSVD